MFYHILKKFYLQSKITILLLQEENLLDVFAGKQKKKKNYNS